MASRRSTRTNNTAPTAVQNGPTRTRATRSQSIDSNAIEASTGASRRSRRPASVESSTDAGQPRTRKGKKAAADPAQDLTTLAEESEERQDNDGHLKSPGTQSNISGTTARMSNTLHELAYLNPKDMLDNLENLYDVSDKILNLCMPSDPSREAFDDLMRNLGPQSRPRKKLNTLKTRFHEILILFASEHCINPALATRGLLRITQSEAIGQGPWRPDEVFFKANLASTLEELISHKAGLDADTDADADAIPLEKLDRDFPERFLVRIKTPAENLPIGSSTLLEESFGVALELRTQFSIRALAALSNRSNFDARRVVKQCFYDTEDGYLRAWSVEGLQREQLSENHNKAIVSRVVQIQQFFDNYPESANAKGLQSQYPVSEFLRRFAVWARARNEEIKQRLSFLDSGQGIGFDIEEALNKELVRRTKLADSREPGEKDYIEIDYQPPSDGLQSGTSALTPVRDVEPKITSSNTLNTEGNIKRLMARAKMAGSDTAVKPAPSQLVSKTVTERRPEGNASEDSKMSTASAAPARASLLRQVHSAEPTSSQSARPASAQHPEDAGPRNNNIDEGNDPNIGMTPLDDEEAGFMRVAPTIIPTPADRKTIVKLQRSIAHEQDKENDPSMAQGRPRQTGKIFERQADAIRVSFDSQPSAHAGSLRHRDEEESQTSDISEDEGFETDNRPHQPRSSIRGQKRTAAATATLQSAKRPRNSQPAPTTRPSFQRPTQTQSNRTPSRLQDYQKVNEHARIISSQKVAKETQIRTKWSNEETNALIELIEEYGISWANLKRIDEDSGSRLASRGQVALKDKARNMKFDYLKSNVNMPNNFNLIPLKQSQKHILRSEFGIESD